MNQVAEGLIAKLKEVGREVAQEKGPFQLYAVVRREGAVGGMWDLVVAAPWLEQDKMEALRYLSRRIQSKLTMPELLSLSRIVIVNEQDPVWPGLRRPIPPDQDGLELDDVETTSIDFEKVFLFASN